MSLGSHQDLVRAAKTILASSKRSSRECRWLLTYLLGREDDKLGDAFLAIESRHVSEFGSYMAAMAGVKDSHLSPKVRERFRKFLGLPVGKQLLVTIELRNALEQWAMATSLGGQVPDSALSLRANLHEYFLPQRWTKAKKPTARQAFEFARGLRPASFLGEMAWSVRAAYAGDMKAQCNVGYYFSECMDSRRYLYWTKKSALQGAPKALFHLGISYAEGSDGVNRNYAKALSYFTKAYKVGYLDAMTEIGRCQLELGRYGSAKKSFEAASTWGDGYAEYNLGVMHEHGFGVPKSESAALGHYVTAAACGLMFAEEAAQTLCKARSR
jgi:TPR repeat protein